MKGEEAEKEEEEAEVKEEDETEMREEEEAEVKEEEEKRNDSVVWQEKERRGYGSVMKAGVR